MKKNRVLIPLDGSEFSERILPQIRRYLDPTENELIILRVAEKPQTGTGAFADMVRAEAWSPAALPFLLSQSEFAAAKHPIFTSQLEDGVAAHIETALLPIVRSLESDGYAVSMAVRFGEPAPIIVNFIENESIDLVAMTTHGRTGLRRAVLGSVAEHVLHHVAAPVLLLRPLGEPAMVEEQLGHASAESFFPA
jgi:nucleotide-binding universal stress UspA family protein